MLKKVLSISLIISLGLNLFFGMAWYNNEKEIEKVIKEKTASIIHSHNNSVRALEHAVQSTDQKDAFIDNITDTEMYFLQVDTVLNGGAYTIGGNSLPSSWVRFYTVNGLSNVREAKIEMINEGVLQEDTIQNISNTLDIMNQISDMLDFNPFEVSVKEQYEIIDNIGRLISEKYND